jgi:hypothetical protein
MLACQTIWTNLPTMDAACLESLVNLPLVQSLTDF